MLVSCDAEFLYEPTTDIHGVTEQKITSDLYKMTVEGHEYLKFEHVGAYGVSISVVHSASCPAKHDFNEFGTDVVDPTVEK